MSCSSFHTIVLLLSHLARNREKGREREREKEREKRRERESGRGEGGTKDWCKVAIGM